MNPPNIKSVLSDSLAQKFLVERLMRFINEKGISGLLLSMRHFTLEEAIDAFRQKLGYQLQDGIRRRMAIVIIYLLHECEYVEKKDEVYVWAGEKDVERKLSADDHKIVKETLKGRLISLKDASCMQTIF
ncbi:MAG: hypothetical protein AAB318_05140, partial [Planctomycetota bacterium]